MQKELNIHKTLSIETLHTTEKEMGENIFIVNLQVHIIPILMYFRNYSLYTDIFCFYQ